METIAKAVRASFYRIMRDQIQQAESWALTLMKASVYDDVQLRNDLGLAYDHLVAARIRAHELGGSR